MVKLHGAVLPSLSEFPEGPDVGRLAFVDDILYVFTDVDGLNSWYPVTNRTMRHVHNQATGSTSWVITHNLNSTQLIVICYDDTGGLITPSNIAYDNSNQITLTFGSLTVGDCAIFIDIAQELTVGGSGDKISEGDSSLEVIDTGTGDIKATVDTVDVFDLTSALQRIGKDSNAGKIRISDTEIIATIDNKNYVTISESTQSFGSTAGTDGRVTTTPTNISLIVGADTWIYASTNLQTLGGSLTRISTIPSGNQIRGFCNNIEVIDLKEALQKLGVDGDSRIEVNQGIDTVDVYCGTSQVLDLSPTGQNIGIAGDSRIYINQNPNQVTVYGGNNQSGFFTDTYAALYHTGDKKFETTADGATVSGTIIASTPTLGTQLTTKDYVDGLVSGLDWQNSVLDKDLNAPPGSPNIGDRYLISAEPPTATGLWLGHDNEFGEWNGTSWDFTAVSEGMACWVEDEDVVYTYNGTAWVKFGTTTTHNNMTGLNDGDYKHLTAAEKTLFDSIETGATADMTASEILTELLTVDGTGTGLDADLLDGIEASAFLQNVVDDTSPQLGAHLDVNGFNITGKPETGIAGNVNIFGGAGSQGGNVNIIGGQGSSTDGYVTIESSQIHLKRNQGSGSRAELLFFDADDSAHVRLKSPSSVTTSRVWELPQDDPTVADGKFLTTNAAGALSFASVGNPNRIEQSNSFLDVTDTGTGVITAEVDGTELASVTSDLITIGNTGNTYHHIQPNVGIHRFYSYNTDVMQLYTSQNRYGVVSGTYIEQDQGPSHETSFVVGGAGTNLTISPSGVKFKLGEFVTGISNDSATDDSSYLLTSEAIHNIVEAIEHNPDKISEGNSSVEVIDSGTGKIEGTVDGTKVFDLSAAEQWFGVGADSRIHMNQSSGQISVQSDAETVATFTTSIQKIGIASDTYMQVNPTANTIEFFTFNGNKMANMTQYQSVLGNEADTYVVANQPIGHVSLVADSLTGFETRATYQRVGYNGQESIYLNQSTNNITMEASNVDVLVLASTLQTLGVAGDSRVEVSQSADTVNIYAGNDLGLTLGVGYQRLGISGDTYVQTAPSSNAVRLYTNSNKALEVGVGVMRFYDNAGTNYGNLHHDSSNVFLLNETDDGLLTIQGSVTAGHNDLFVGDPNGAAELYHAGVKKLETSSTGIAVTSEVKFMEATGSEYVGLKSPAAVTTARSWTLPVDDPSTAAGKFLTTNSSGVLSFNSPSVTPASLYYNDADIKITAETDKIVLAADLRRADGATPGNLLVKGGNVTGGSTYSTVLASGDVNVGATAVNGQTVNVIGGNNYRTSGTAIGGNAEIAAGHATSASLSNGVGGNVEINAGDGYHTGGHIILKPGNDIETGAEAGYIKIEPSNGNATTVLKFMEASGTEYVGLKAPTAMAATVSWTLPGESAATADGKFLTTNSSGIMSFAEVGTPSRIEEGNSYVDIDDSGSGIITGVVDGTELLDITTGNIRLGGTSNHALTINSSLGWTNIVTATKTPFRVSDDTQHIGLLTDTYIQLDQSNNLIEFTGTFSGTGDIYANTYYGDGSNLTASAPTTGSHLTTKDYVDGLVSGLDWQNSVLDKDLNAPPGSPTTGDRYLISTAPPTATGLWVGHDNEFGEWNGTTWDFTAVSEGMSCWVEDEDIVYVYNGTGWVKFGSTTTHNNASGLNDGDYKHLTAAEKTLFDGIESGATADQTPTELLTAIKTVDGPSSGLNADLLDSVEGSNFLRSDVADQANGLITFAAGVEASGGAAAGLFLENGKHHITSNDGGGNFNIRIGNTFADDITEVGYASHLVFGQDTGRWDFKITTASQAVGETPAWRIPVQMYGGSSGTAMNVAGDITVSGTVDTRDIAADGTKLDTIDLDNLLKSNEADTATGLLTLSGGFTAFNATNDYTASTVTFGRDSNQFMRMHGHSTGNMLTSKSTDGNPKPFVLDVRTDATNQQYIFHDDVAKITIAGDDVWHEGNDGPGSGLNADLLDGVEASAFLQNLSEDTSPQLGADLDANGFDITTQSGSSVSSMIIKPGTVTTGSSPGSNLSLSGGSVGGIGTGVIAGNIFIAGGNNSAVGGGIVRLTGGLGNTGDGGIVDIVGGGSTDGDGGEIILQPGNSVNGDDGFILVKAPSSSPPAELRFQETGAINYVGLKAPSSITTSRSWILPEDDPATAAGQFLTTDSSGVLSFAEAATSPAGNDNEVQYNDSGSFGSSANFTYTGTALQVGAPAGAHTSITAGIVGAPNANLTLIAGLSGYNALLSHLRLINNSGAELYASQGAVFGANGPGGSVHIESGSGAGTGNGGVLDIIAGDGGATSGAGGVINITGGASANQSPGDIYVTGGQSSSSSYSGGQVKIAGGENTSTSTGGAVALEAGSSNLVGGPVYIRGGNGDSGGTVGGAVTIQGGRATGTGGSGAGSLYLYGGNSNTVDNIGAGNVNIVGGSQKSTSTIGTGGDIVLTPGFGFTHGDIIIDNVPEKDIPTELQFRHGDNAAAYVGLKAPQTVTTSRVWTLPQDDPSAVDGYFLKTDSNGVLSFSEGGASNAISQLNSNVTVTDAGTGVITAEADGTEVLDLTSDSQRIGISGVASNISISQSGDLIQMYSNGVRHYYQSPTEVLVGKSNDTNMYILPEDNDIIFECNNDPQLHINVNGISLDGETNNFNDTLVSTDGLDVSSPDTAFVSAKLVYESIQAFTPTEITEGNSFVKVTDAGTGEITAEVDGTQVADLTATGQTFGVSGDTNIQLVQSTGQVAILGNNTTTANFYPSLQRIGKSSLAGRLDVSDTGVELYHAGTKKLETTSTGARIFDSAGTKSINVFHDGTDAFIRNEHDGGGIKLQVEVATDTVEDILVGVPGGATQLFFDGSRVFNTTADGMAIKDPIGDEPVLYFRDDSDGENLRIAAYSTHLGIEGHNGASWDDYALFNENGIKLATGATVNNISNDSATDSATALLTSEAVHNLFASEITGAHIHTQSSASTSWTVTHNLGYKYVNVQVIDDNDKAIIPDEITFNSTSQLTVTFLSAESGYAAVTSGGGTAGAGIAAGRVTLSTDDVTADVTFDLPQANTTYAVVVSISNSVDTTPSEYSYTITDKTVNGFTVLFSGPIENDNYILEWITGIGGADENRVWVDVDSDYSASVGNKLMVFTSGGEIEVTLPAAPVFGDEIDIVDGDINFGTNNCKLLRNGKNIEGNAGDYILNSDKADAKLVYANAATGWRVING